jgi:multimeric flavodoxin WrbA
MVLPKLLRTQRLVFATPIYFMSVCAQAKILIDRCQCLWARKHILEQPICETPERHRLGMVIAVGAKKNKKMFECIRLTMKYYFDALDMGYFASLFVGGFETGGTIADNTQAMEQAFRLGVELAGAGGAAQNPIEIEITGS